MKNTKLSTMEAIGAIIMGCTGIVLIYNNYTPGGTTLVVVATVWAVHAHYSWKVND